MTVITQKLILRTLFFYEYIEIHDISLAYHVLCVIGSFDILSFV